MISAIQNSPVNTPKLQNKVAFGTMVTKDSAGRLWSFNPFRSETVPPKKAVVPQSNSNFLKGLLNTFEKGVKWLVGFKG